MTSFDTNGRGFGLLCGATMAVGASLTFAAARAGILAGMAPEALILLRFAVSGLFYLPLVLRWGFSTLAGIGWPRGMVLLLTGGPAFVLLQLGGYVFAPLAHGAVIAPSAVTIISTGLAAVFQRERLTRAHLSGAALVIVGLVLPAWEGLAHSGGQDDG